MRCFSVLSRHRRSVTRPARYLALLPLLGFFLACNLLAEEMERDESGLLEQSEKLEQLVRTSKSRSSDPEMEEQLRRIACTVSEASCDSLRVYLLNLPGFNAFVLPNGAIFVQTGLLVRAQSEAEIAAAIAHEITHYEEQHTLKRIRKQSGTAATFAVLGAVVGAAGNIATLGATGAANASSAAAAADSAAAMLSMMQGFAALALLDYSRDQEKEADLKGVSMLRSVGYDPTAAERLWTSYLEEEKSAPRDDTPLSLLSTHPLPAQRIKYLSEIESEHTEAQIMRDGEILKAIQERRRDWLLLEMRVLHPQQFRHLTATQSDLLGLSRGVANQLSAESWIRHSQKSGLFYGEKEKAVKEALEIYEQAHLSDGELSPDGYREWGMLAKDRDDVATMKLAWGRYLELSPDAWDANMIKRRLAKLD